MIQDPERTDPAIRRIVRRSLHEQVTDRLRDMVVEGEFAAGARLNEGDLAAALGVSRTPVREALKVLATEGLVDLLPGRGARVSHMSEGDLAALFEVVAGLERHAVELATARITPRELAALRRLHDRMAGHFAAQRRHAYFAANHEIHRRLVALSGNPVLAGLHATLLAKVRRGRYAALEGERWAEAMGEHERLMAAITARDAAAASAIMLLHIRRTNVAACRALADPRAEAKAA
ncbi:MAG TPA: GntR family transcriptional regulator [Acetobacteraceae bacterium]|nr:GntR family transcriptional regulator [Acetobacteraceae bacterium]